MNKIDAIDQALDRLVENAEAMQEIGNNPLLADEYVALEKTQESLLAHLLSYEKEAKETLEIQEIQEAFKLFDKSYSSGRQSQQNAPRMQRERKVPLQVFPD